MPNHPPIPLIDIRAQNGLVEEEIVQAVLATIRNSSFILGAEVKEFEADFLRYTGAAHAVACASGSDALLLPLMAIGVGPGDEVLVPSFTFYATVAAVARLGATPVFVDSDASYNLDLSDLSRKIGPRTKAVIPVHLFGRMVDMELLQRALAGGGRKIWVIEDCAQSLGARFDGQAAGTVGDYGAFSFYPTKNLGAMGDAGLVTVKSGELAERIRMLRVHGSSRRYYHELLGTNSRLDTIQAAILRIKLRHLAGYEEKRSFLAQAYELQLSAPPLRGRVQVPAGSERRRHVWNQYTIRAEDRDELKSFLAERGIGSEVYYPLPMHQQAAFKPYVRAGEALPMADRLAAEVLSLPMYPELPLASVERVTDTIKEFYLR